MKGCQRAGRLGCLQSLDWTSELDWWTDTKSHFFNNFIVLNNLTSVKDVIITPY